MLECLVVLFLVQSFFSVIAKVRLFFDDGITDIISDAKNYETFHDEYIFNRFDPYVILIICLISKESVLLFFLSWGRHTMNLTRRDRSF